MINELDAIGPFFLAQVTMQGSGFVVFSTALRYLQGRVPFDYVFALGTSVLIVQAVTFALASRIFRPRNPPTTS
jgi:hypothetical protein